MTVTPLASRPERGRFETNLLLIAVLAATGITLLQFTHCVSAGNCLFAEDFPVFYGPAHAMASGAVAAAYPVESARAWLRHPAEGFFHYSLYPPGSLLAFYPLGFLRYPAALTVWFGLQLALLGAASCLLPRAAQRDPHARTFPLLIFLPFVTLCLLAGQIAIASAGFFLLAFRWRDKHPWRAGAMLALLALKPQLALMLPVLFLAEGRIKPLLAAAGFTLALQLAATGFFGPAIWEDYRNMLALSPSILSLAPAQLLTASLSPALSLRMLGLSADACLWGQAGVTLAVLLSSAKALRRCAADHDKLVLLSLSTLLVSPYLFHYDAVILAFPCLVWLKRWREGAATSSERISLILLAFLPLVAFKLQAMHIPYGCLAILGAYLGALHACRPRPDRPA